jgi:hypothetical protein
MKRFIIALTFCLITISQPSYSASLDATVLINKSGDNFEYIINGKKIEKTLRYFSDLIVKEGPDSTVDIYFSSDIPFGIVSNLKGIIQKAGIRNVRHFYFNEETKNAIELQYKGEVFVAPKSIINN